MDAAVTRNVTEIGCEGRRALEGLLGETLSDDQHVFIMAFTPGEPPNDAVRSLAKQRLEQTLTKNQAFAKELGVTAAEVDEAVAEAMHFVRRRE